MMERWDRPEHRIREPRPRNVKGVPHGPSPMRQVPCAREGCTNMTVSFSASVFVSVMCAKCMAQSEREKMHRRREKLREERIALSLRERIERANDPKRHPKQRPARMKPKRVQKKKKDDDIGEDAPQ